MATSPQKTRLAQDSTQSMQMRLLSLDLWMAKCLRAQVGTGPWKSSRTRGPDFGPH